MTDNIRAFIAFELPKPVISSIRSIQEGLRSHRLNMRWVRPENIHLTLKFLGNISAADTEKAGGAMVASAKQYAPISLEAKGIGAFPGIKRPRVIWVGLTGQMDLLRQLHRKLDENLAATGFLPEKRPFKGHLTISRVKGRIDPGRLIDAIDEFRGFQSEPFTAETLILFKSELKSAGAVYSKLLSVSLNRG